ncbi:glycosyltransferase [Brachybacterium sp. AOP43-C2-M15]|uniref:glycosyltransferase n=1 Tax=Brachybacterium sp. AOP43-C2-M15 TaxID=3457661 RepID=UPI0040337255
MNPTAIAESTSQDDPPRSADQRVLQRLILPVEVSPDIVPLYIEAEEARASSAGGSVGLRGEIAASFGDADDVIERTAARTRVDVNELSERHGVRIPARAMRSFGTYFNAFPASYWRRWTAVRKIRLTVRTLGAGQLIVMRSTARGSLQRHLTIDVTTDGEQVVELPLTAFGDGGWYWFDAYAGGEDLVILGAEWSADAGLARTEGSFSIAMTTMNKVEYCLENIRTIAQDGDLRSLLDVMYVVDQGSDRLRDHPEDLAPLSAELGGQLQIIEQGNIGGSGGFSRGMYEAATAGTSTYVINCDDDIVIESESLIRMVTFADFAVRPTLVGAHMFDLNNRSVLHAFGEIVDPWTIQPALPRSAPEMQHDFAQHPLRSTPWLHRRTDVDYNGWWTCLIPTETVRAIGLSLPVFIKWDDTEYGLRARDHGYPTVSLPGAGVWHVTWADKNDALDWQVYFHERNRIITALLHSHYERGGGVLGESQSIDIKHLISMQYYTEQARLKAQADVLRGPDHLHREISLALPELRAMVEEFDDSTTREGAEAFPAVRRERPPRKGRDMTPPRRTMLPAWTAKMMMRQLAKSTTELSRVHPQTEIAHQDAKWWRLSRFDSAVVSNAEGTRAAWYKRDPEAVRRMLVETLRTHAALLLQWSSLSARYREASARITSFAAWERTFADNPAPVRERDRAADRAARTGGTRTGEDRGPAA